MTMLRRIICCSFTVNNHFHEYGCGYDVGPASAPPPQHWTATSQCCKARHDSNQHGRIASDQATPTLIPTIWQGPQGQYCQCQCAHCANKLLAPVCKGDGGAKFAITNGGRVPGASNVLPKAIGKSWQRNGLVALGTLTSLNDSIHFNHMFC